MAAFDGYGPTRGHNWSLVKALLPLPCLAELSSRNFVVRLLADELGPLTIDEHSMPMQHVFAIVDACRHHPDGLITLLEVVGRFDRDTRYFPEVQRIVTEMTALEVWPKTERDQLFTLLSGMAFTDVELYRQIAGAGAPELPAQSTYREVLLSLETLNADPAGLPKPLVFLEHVAHRVRPELAIELRRWADRQASKLGLTTELQALRRGFPARPAGPPPNSPAYLVLMIRYEGDTGERYRLSHWRQLDLTEGWHPERGDDLVGSIEQIKRWMAVLIEGVEADWAHYQPDIHIEVILALDLLNLDIDQWPWESELTTLPVPVGCRYAMAVRSLDRMQRKSWHRGWHARWGTLTEQINSMGAVAETSGCRGQSSDESALRALAAGFEKDLRLVSLTLSAPPCETATGHAEVTVGLRAGLPIIMWHRSDCGSEDFLATANELLHGDSPGNILHRVRILRANAFAADHTHVGRHLALLWDDPERIVVPNDAGPPKGESVA